MASITLTALVLIVLLAILWVSGVFAPVPEHSPGDSAALADRSSSVEEDSTRASSITEGHSSASSSTVTSTPAQTSVRHTLAVWKDGMLVQDKAGLNLLSIDAEEYRDIIFDDNLAVRASDLEDLKTQVRDGDPEAAYLLFWFYLDCYTLPLHREQLEPVIAQLESSGQSEFDAASDPELIEQRINDVKTARLFSQRMEDCTEDPFEAQVLTYEWLQRSAELGHVTAATDFVRWGGNFLTQNKMFLKQPHRVVAYKQDSIRLLMRAIDAGHPEAMLNLAKVHHDGVLLEQNLSEAYSWAHAANLAYTFRGYHSKSSMDEWLLRELGKELSSSEVRAARVRGRALFERHVDQSN